jgi:hypothetical protein
MEVDRVDRADRTGGEQTNWNILEVGGAVGASEHVASG